MTVLKRGAKSENLPTWDIASKLRRLLIIGNFRGGCFCLGT